MLYLLYKVIHRECVQNGIVIHIVHMQGSYQQDYEHDQRVIHIHPQVIHNLPVDNFTVQSTLQSRVKEKLSTLYTGPTNYYESSYLFIYKG